MGWYQVSFSDDLTPGQVLPKRYFGEDLVLFRTESGEARLLAAHCAHLGAHLGHGGVITGESISCPFHGWRFDGQGVCLEVPYAKKRPAVVGRQCLRTWHIHEANRTIFAWYHPQGRPPAFPIEEIADFADNVATWSPLFKRRWTVKCHIQETHENIIDQAHFKIVHGFDARFHVEYSGHKAVVEMDASGSSHSRVTTYQNGPGQTWARYAGFPELLILNAVTPVEREVVEFNVGVAFPAFMATQLGDVCEMVLKMMCEQVERDIPIFENKVYRQRPLVCTDDGPILEFRRWYRQFYPGVTRRARQSRSRAPAPR
jgi:phenylpropionate dioxygenase-like ring-hydroxylating dioxygenase large terminal subunit